MSRFDKNLSKVVLNGIHLYHFLENTDMAKGSRQCLPPPKRGVNLNNKRTSESITPADDDVNSDVGNQPTSKLSKRASLASVASVASVASLPKQTNYPIATRKIVPMAMPMPPTTQVVQKPMAMAIPPARQVSEKTTTAGTYSRKKVRTTTSMPPTTQVFEKPTAMTVPPTTQVFEKPTAAGPIFNLYSGEDNASVVQDAALVKPSVLLTTAMSIELKNLVSLQNRTIITLQNKNRELLSDHEQATQFSKWDEYITKIVGKLFHITKFAYHHVSKHYILTL